MTEILHDSEDESDWTWRDDSGPDGGPATLCVQDGAWSWQLEMSETRPLPPPVVRLSPANPDIWHDLTARTDTLTPGAWFPLPRLLVRSPFYHDLLDLLQHLTTPRFGQRVCRWYRTPVPTYAPEATSGSVDLQACFADAVALWNEGETEPFFAWKPDTALGTRLLHMPGTLPRPPMSAHLIQRDAQGRAQRLYIRVGDNYDDPVDEPYARRGFVHELAHALLLWGHSRDRDHILWQYGPIVSRPSADERRAVRLLQALPAGMDLSVYGRSTELDP